MEVLKCLKNMLAKQPAERFIIPHKYYTEHFTKHLTLTH